MSKIKISIIITCYNLGKYLDEALNSVLKQKYIDWECIIVNDGSTDNTEFLANQWVNSDSRFSYLYQKNKGVSSARNLGIKKAQGLYILPLDADNILRPNFTYNAIGIFETHSDVDIVYGDVQFFGNKNYLCKLKPFNINEILLNNYIDTCACFKKSNWIEVDGYDCNMPIYGFEDWDLWLRMAVKGFCFYYLEDVSFDYRVRNNSLLSDAWTKRELLLSYIFSKKELQHLAEFRKVLIENQKLKETPSFRQIFSFLVKKILKKVS